MSDIERTYSLGLEPLPAEFGSDLARLDAQLGAVIRADGVPAGLEQRVLAATLADATTSRDGVPLQLVGTAPAREPARLSFTHTHWGRLAMAAGLGLAFAIGWWAMNPTPPAGTQSNDVAVNDTGRGPVGSRSAVMVAQADAGREFVTVSMQRIMPDSVSDMEGDFASLFQTGNETSYDELSAELAAVVTGFSPTEM